MEPLKKEAKSLEQHLFARELVDFEVLTRDVMYGTVPLGRAEITLDSDLLAKVSDAWERDGASIRAVISARIKKLLIAAALHDIPQEVVVTRQSIVELLGVLADFEALHKEQSTRNANKATSNEV